MKGPQSLGWGLAGDSDHGPTIAHPLAWLPSSPQTLNLTLKPGPHAATPSQQVLFWHAGHCPRPEPSPRGPGGWFPAEDTDRRPLLLHGPARLPSSGLLVGRHTGTSTPGNKAASLRQEACVHSPPPLKSTLTQSGGRTA